MIKPEKPHDEDARLAALRSYNVLDSEREESYDDLVAIAAAVCDVGHAAISLIDSERQWVKAGLGVPEGLISRDESLCAHAILDSDQLMVVRDASVDERFQGNPLITAEDGIRFYAGAPLVTPDGHAIGTLCVFDSCPGDLDESQQRTLHALSRQVTHLFELRRTNKLLNLHIIDRAWYEEQLHRYHEQLESRNADLVEQTRTDPLTDLPNRRAFDAALETAIGKCVDSGSPLSVAVLDIDHFKLVNDLHGHAEGDQVLVQLAKLLKAQFSGGGMAARHGGEEFVMLFPAATLQQASLQCEFLRQSVLVLPLGLPVTVSIGVAQLKPRHDDSASLLKRADEAMYAAKNNGRNRVSLAG